MGYEQLPIQVQLTLVSNPPVIPVDIQTGLPPQIWVRRAAAVQIAVFNQYNASVDLSNLQYLQLVVSSNPNSLTPVITSTVTATYITSIISYQEWIAGNQFQAVFDLSNAQTDISLNGENSAQYWMSIQGLTTAGNMITYGAGYVTFYNPGYNVPAPSGFYVSYNAQSTTTSTTFTVSPASQLHTEWITLGGSGGNRSCVISGFGLYAGAHVYLRFSTGLAYGITINVYDTTITNPILCTFTSDQYTPAGELHLVWNGNNYQVLDTIIPAAGTLS